MISRTRANLSPDLVAQRAAAATAVSLASILTNLTCSIQNCNSLNVSTNCPKQLKKIEAITNCNSNVIFLSDLRLNNSDSVQDLERIFLSSKSNRYNFFFNSSRNKRGTGLLISHALEFQVLDTFKDEKENILGVHGSISNFFFIFISVYGPNNVDPQFFADLRRCIALNPDANIICGGDWNLTYSTADTELNIDIFRMQSPPSLIRSRALADVCEFFQLSDPFRALHPDRLDFTYRPRNGLPNRSRIDFFLISDSLIQHLSNCEIAPEISTELFDHHRVLLSFCNNQIKLRQSINHTILTHPRFPEVLSAAVADTYINHADPENNPLFDLNRGRLEVGSFLTLLREINDLEHDIALNGNNLQFELQLDNKLRELEILKNAMPDPEQLDSLSLSCPDDNFLEVLMGNIRNAVISFQSWVKKVQNLKKSTIISRINLLRGDFIIHSNEISDLQAELNTLVEADIREKIKSMKLFEGLHSEKPSPIFLALARSRNKGNLSSLKNDTGSEFNSPAEQGEYIASFFENLYRAPPGEELGDQVIEDFLGENICSNPVVTNSKLKVAELTALEGNLTLD